MLQWLSFSFFLITLNSNKTEFENVGYTQIQAASATKNPLAIADAIITATDPKVKVHFVAVYDANGQTDTTPASYTVYTIYRSFDTVAVIYINRASNVWTINKRTSAGTWGGWVNM